MEERFVALKAALFTSIDLTESVCARSCRQNLLDYLMHACNRIHVRYLHKLRDLVVVATAIPLAKAHQ